MVSTERIDIPDLEERDQHVYPPRGEQDLERIIDEMVEVKDEEVQEAVREISSITDDSLRNGQNSVEDHFQAPIRSLNNPVANQVEIQQQYKTGENTLLSNTGSVEAFNRLFNDQKPPTKEGEVVGEEYFVGQNLPGFQYVGNIKWWTVMDDGSYREERRNRGFEHLNLNNEGDIHSFHVELDGEPIDGDDAIRLARNLRTRSKFQVTDENTVPQNILRYDSREELLENEDITEEEYVQQVEKAIEEDLITKDGDLTLKGWTIGANLEAPDLRELDELSGGDEFVDFEDDTETYLNLEIATLGAEARLEATTDYISGNLRVAREGGQVNIEGEGDENFPENVRNFMENYGWAGFSTDQSPRERQDLESEMLLSEYFEQEGIDIEHVDGNRLRVRNENVEDRIYNQLNDSAISFGNADIDITDTDVDYEIKLVAKEGGEELSRDNSEIPNSFFEEIEQELDESIDFKSGTEMIATTPIDNIGGGNLDNWNRLFDSDDGTTTEISRTLHIGSPVRALLNSKHEDELEDLQDDYRPGTVSGEYIPNYEDASQELMDTVETLEKHSLVKTEDVTKKEARLSITANELEYNETIEKLSDLDVVKFTETKDQMYSEEKNHHIPLENVKAEIEVVDGREDEVAERLEDYQEEIMDELMVSINREVKDEKLPQFKDFIHNELEAGKLGELLSSITPRVRYSEKERIPDYENWSDRLFHPISEDIHENSDWSPRTVSDELMDEFADMHEEGLIDGELDYSVECDREYHRENVTIPGDAIIDNYRDLDEETLDEIEELNERGLIDIEQPEYHLELRTSEYDDGETTVYEPREKLEVQVDIEAESTELEMGDTTVELEGNYQTTGETNYRANEELLKIAESLDPLNFDSRPYEEVTVNTEFEYGDELSA